MQVKPFTLAVKAVIVNDRGESLLLRRSASNTSFVGCWEWPGGKVEPGEDFASAVVRETKEEAGLDIGITGLAGATEFEMPTFHIVLLCMEARVAGGTLRLSEEHDAVDWVPWSDLGARSLPPRIGDFMMEYGTGKGKTGGG